MTVSTDTRSAPFPGGRRARQPGWYIPWLFVAFFLVVFAANGVMIWIAMATYTGLETENHFVKGIHYNDDLDGARRQAERAWAVGVDFQSAAERKGTVALSLRDKHGNLLTGAKVVATFLRPTQAGFDQTIELGYLGEGRYGTDVEFPMSGNWDIRIRIDHSTGDWQDQRRIWVK